MMNGIIHKYKCKVNCMVIKLRRKKKKKRETERERIREGKKKRMREIESVLQTRGNVGAQLILIDEPYHGTVEFEASKRVYDFCYAVMDVPCLLMIATHLQKPIMLEADTQGKFVNFQMDYTEDDLGNITRSFKFIPGPAFWWFNDSVKRSRFIDSLEFN